MASGNKVARPTTLMKDKDRFEEMARTQKMLRRRFMFYLDEGDVTLALMGADESLEQGDEISEGAGFTLVGAQELGDFTELFAQGLTGRGFSPDESPALVCGADKKLVTFFLCDGELCLAWVSLGDAIADTTDGWFIEVINEERAVALWGFIRLVAKCKQQWRMGVEEIGVDLEMSKEAEEG